MSVLARRIVTLRTARQHLEAQLADGADTPRASLGRIARLLSDIERDLAEAETRARQEPDLAYLFPPRRRR